MKSVRMACRIATMVCAGLAPCAHGQPITKPATCAVTTFTGGIYQLAVLGEVGCTLTDGTRADFYSFPGSAGSVVDVILRPRTQFGIDGDQPLTFKAPVLILFPPPGDAAAAPFILGNPAGEAAPSQLHLRHVLTSTGTWTIGVGTRNPSANGPYVMLASVLDPLNDYCRLKQPLDCEQTIGGLDLSRSACRFVSDGQRYVPFLINAIIPGDVFDLQVTSNDFPPMLAVYPGGTIGHTDPTLAQPVGSSAARIHFVAPTRYDFNPVVFSRDDGRAGVFTLSLHCTRAVCTPPAIVSAPGSQTVAYGADITLEVVATGLEPLDYEWDQTMSFTSVIGHESTVVLHNQKKDSSISVQVHNQCGTAYSDAVQIHVLPPRPRRRGVGH